MKFKLNLPVIKHLILVLVLVVVVSCKKEIPTNKLTIIEDFVLGGKSASTFRQLDSLKIPSKKFFNVIMPRERDLLDDNIYISSYYTDIFNFNEFRNSKESIEHIGLLAPITLKGTENNFALTVILGHTVRPWLIGEMEKYKDKLALRYFRQEINNALIVKILEMYVTKYGIPTSTDTLQSSDFWMIDGNSFSKEHDSANQVTTYEWETEYYTVTFYTGIDLNGIYFPNGIYVESTNRYRANISDERADPEKGEMNCRAFPYVYYRLNEKGINELKINNLKL